MKYLESVIESGLFEKVDKKDYIQVFESLRVYGKELHKGDIIFYEDDDVDRVCIIYKGSVRAEKNYADGELHIIDLHEQGKIFALEELFSRLGTSTMDYICNEDSVIVSIPIGAIRASECCNEMMAVLLRMLADENIRKMRKIEILAERSLRRRIMIYLEVLRKKSQSDTVHVNMDREQLAQFLCVNRSALSNELNKMKREGIISFKKREFTLLK